MKRDHRFASGFLVLLVLLGACRGQGDRASTLQVRPVLGEGEGCDDHDVNPAPEDDANLQTMAGECLTVGAAALVVEQADARRDASTSSVLLTLSDEDSDSFNAVAANSVGERLALVMFGTILSAPTVQQESYDGDLQLSELPSDFAERVVASLGG